MLKMFLILTMSIGGAYGFGYIEGQINAREQIFGKNVKRVDRRRRRY